MRTTLLAEFLDTCVRTAHEAGRLTLGYFGTDPEAEFKADDSPVTQADRAAEELIRARLEAAYPDHGLVGEEWGVARESAPLKWYIDPIDGTKSFMRGVPLYAVLLGLEEEGEPVVGAAYFPALGEMLYAAKGLGAHLNGRRVRVRDTPTLARSFVSFTDAASFAPHGRAAAWERIAAASYYRVGWSDAYGHALVASGRLELMLDPVLNPYDAGPFGVILPEAGGYFGDWSGRPGIHGGEGLSTSLRLLPEVLALIAG
ncbi:MAG: histidinol phosphate phosphatase [Trueperaceae bacterium]|nr:histidinol phosphate phosphatase [Trueperaceae bacterium]